MVNRHFSFKQMGPFAVAMLLAGCGGGANDNGLTSLANSYVGNAVAGAAVNSVEQNILGNALNGQVSTLLNPMEQTYRAQQLRQVLQSGMVNQAQQWTHPQTGATFSLNPVGQQMFDPQTRQPCQMLQETVVLQNGQTVQENRRACQNPKTGQWVLVQ